MYQAWIRGHPPPSFPTNYIENPASIPPLSQAQVPTTVDLSPQHAPGLTPYPHYPSTSSQTFHAPPAKTASYPALVFVAPPQATLHRYSSEPAFKVPDAQYYAPEPTFKVPDHYSYTSHFEPPIETEKPSKKVEQDEIFRKVKILYQYLRIMQGIGNQVSVAYKDLCLFPDVQLPAGFKMPKFDLYDGHGDPMVHLRGFCSKIRGAGCNDKLLMAYFSQNIVLDRLSLTKVEKKPSESFREYRFRWREKAARVNPPMEEDDMLKYFLQALEPTYFGHLISAVGKPFIDVVKMGEMVEKGLKSRNIMSYSAIKATTQAIQSGTGSLVGKKKKDDIAMTYAQPPSYPQCRAPAPQNPYPPQQPYRNPTGPNFRPRSDYRREKKQWKETFTPLGESYARHNKEKFWHLKRAVQELIDTHQIKVQSLDAPNINQNPLPAHAETHMIEIVRKDGESNNSSNSIMMICASEGKSIKAPDSTKAMPLTIERVTEKSSMLNVKSPVPVVKAAPKDIRASQEKTKVVVLGISIKPFVVVKGARITPIVIKPVTQLPVVDTKAVPWNYKQVIVTYKGKEVEEEVNETRELTRSRRCFTPEELRMAKTFMDSKILVKKPVTEEEAEEFLRKDESARLFHGATKENTDSDLFSVSADTLR
ncbi:PREDICTED: uncharacterized protein LOC109216134 [Nicotiana attenuata]|uniref:uncharacterized protein LOC109216134 n=1 Tax=Nicotiana attenuata TaxID=49451 RepID=UPI000905B475|nr:PREDICTED: uncharacterized protein LOC109216134 [Nicotiana attenuata]